MAVMRARVRSRAFSKPYPSNVCRVTGIVLGANRLKGESGSVAQAQRSEKKTRRSTTSCVRLDGLLRRLRVRAEQRERVLSHAGCTRGRVLAESRSSASRRDACLE